MAKKSSIVFSQIPLWAFSLILLVSDVKSHNESGEWNCESDSGSQIVAEFRPGTVTLDGHADDWKEVDGVEFSLLPALDPHEDDAYTGGKMTVKALHDGKDVFFLLQVDGDYAYSQGENNKCPSVALMFQIGENATYHNMGGCKESTSSCTDKTCQGYEVDLMHFSLGNAIPGRLYGGNPLDVGYGGDRFGHLVDLYSWNPHCRYLDGRGPSGNNANNTGAQNDWKGAWWHSSLSLHSGFVEANSPYASKGSKGTYYFEFSRPLRTMDRFQQVLSLLFSKLNIFFFPRFIGQCSQDAQFKIGEASKFSAAFWYPVNGKPWGGSSHFTVSCVWLPLQFSSGGSGLGSSSSSLAATQKSPWDAAVAFSLLLSVVAFCVSVFVGLRVSRNPGVAFTPMNNL
ncbi:hypothetical protein V2J09_022175 [Rumex salicifolius]